MDPEKTLEALLFATFALLGSVQQVGWGASVREMDDNYRTVLEHKRTLANWVDIGGYEPVYYYRLAPTSYGQAEAMASNVLHQAEALYVAAGISVPVVK